MTTSNNYDTPPLEEPLAELERQLIKAYVTGAGHDFEALRARNNDQARKLLAAASQYAAARLTEVEARSRYLRHLHGDA